MIALVVITNVSRYLLNIAAALLIELLFGVERWGYLLSLAVMPAIEADLEII